MKGPAAVRNMIYSRLGIWPVSELAGADLQSLPVYCISLLRATRKRRLMEAQARGLGLQQFRFIDGVDALSLNRAKLLADGVIDDETSRRYHSRPLTLNEIACSLSHRLAYEAIVAGQHEAALILEDDALFHSRRCRNVRLSDFPRGYDCVFLNTFLSEERPRCHVGGDIYTDASYSGSAAAYVVSAAGASKLLRASFPVVHAADGLLGRAMKSSPGEAHPFRGRGASEELTCYIIFPNCVTNGSVAFYHVSEVQQEKYRDQVAEA